MNRSVFMTLLHKSAMSSPILLLVRCMPPSAVFIMPRLTPTGGEWSGSRPGIGFNPLEAADSINTVTHPPKSRPRSGLLTLLS